MPRYPSSVKAEARRLVKEGATQRTVAKKLKISEGTLSRWLQVAPTAAPKRASKPTEAVVVAPSMHESSTFRTIRAVLAMASLFDSTKVAVIKALLQ